MHGTEKVETTILMRAPGNGTQYRIFLTPNPWGGWNWAWIPEAGIDCGGWASQRKGGELRVTAGKLGKVDKDAIRDIIDEIRQ